MKYGTRWKATLLVGMLGFSIMGCSGGRKVDAGSQYPTSERPRPGGPAPEEPRRGMSAGKKLMLVAGAAAVYYLYQKHKDKPGEGENGRYYRSKNGRVYYRNMKTGEYRWVDPPAQPLQVPAEEFERYFDRPAGSYGGETIREAPSRWKDPLYR